MTSKTETLTELLGGLLSQFDNVGIKSPKHNTWPHTGGLTTLISKLKSKLSQLFI